MEMTVVFHCTYVSICVFKLPSDGHGLFCEGHFYFSYTHCCDEHSHLFILNIHGFLGET